MAGSSGAWEPGDATGRDYVPGPLALVAETGSIQLAQPEALPNPSIEITRLTWEYFQDFVICGQIYE